MLNAWELLLKARVLAENSNNPKSIESWQHFVKKDGTKSIRRRPDRSRSGNIKTIGMDRAAGLVRSYATKNIDNTCAANLDLIAEIRDTAVHFRHNDLGLAVKVHEVGTAAVRNFVTALDDWFSISLDEMNFYLMPLAFQPPAAVVESLYSDQRSTAVSRLLDHIQQQEVQQAGGSFAATLKIKMTLSRSNDNDAEVVKLGKGGANTVAITLSEEDIRERYPWDYETLTKRLRERYSDFLANQKYHDLRQPLEAVASLCHTRLLNPENAASSTKKFYSPNIVQKFDGHYQRKLI
tara:strand:+ start:100 stop:981 length:882 start_codon:yes stop_codon:yes gene_type:complete